MKVLDILAAPWAILPEKKLEIDGIYATHLRGEKIDIKGVEAALGRPLNNQQQGYSVINGVAVLAIDGVIAKRMNLLTQISGGVSTTQLQQDFTQALEDPSVSAIVLQIDSPGGAVDGTQEMANLIYQARGKKPIVALADGCMCSAAYWIGAAADQVFAGSDTTMVGSIGVVASHVDVSGAEAQRGVKTTEITAGKFKRVASQYGPLSQEGRQSIQDQLDHIYGVFTGAVSQYRGIGNADAVDQTMADGRVFLGQQAVDAGLVDGISTLDQIISQLIEKGSTSALVTRPGAVLPKGGPNQKPTAGAAVEPEPNPKENKMDETIVKIEASEVAAAVDAQVSSLKAEFVAKGADAERQRIQDVLAQALPGHEALVNGLAFDGKTTGPEAAVQVLNAERAKKGVVLSNLKADAPTPVPSATVDTSKASETKEKALDPHLVAAEANKYQDAEADAGRTVSTAQAVAHVTNLLKQKEA